jgi:hypothetical protein
VLGKRDVHFQGNQDIFSLVVIIFYSHLFFTRCVGVAEDKATS